MCIYHTYHWFCCPGTAQAAPYYMHLRCAHALQPKPYGFQVRNSNLDAKRCVIEHRVLDGADHDEPCPRCGNVTLDEVEQELWESREIGR